MTPGEAPVMVQLAPPLGDGSGGQPIFTHSGVGYFAASDDVQGLELWRTDGTPAGTRLLKDIQAGLAGSAPADFTVYNGQIYFAAEGSGGRELWRTDGTSAGTVRVLDLNPGAAWSSPLSLEVYNGLLYFGADDGLNGRQLWRTDGTESGTELFLKVLDNVGDYQRQLNPHSLFVFRNRLHFTAPNLNGPDFSSTDGVSVSGGDGAIFGYQPYNDRLVRDILVVNGTLFYLKRTSGEGPEFYMKTPEPRTQFKYINAGPGGPSPGNLTDGGNVVYFTASSLDHGPELWKSDGTRRERLTLNSFQAFTADGPSTSNTSTAFSTSPRILRTSDANSGGPMVRSRAHTC